MKSKKKARRRIAEVRKTEVQLTEHLSGKRVERHFISTQRSTPLSLNRKSDKLAIHWVKNSNQSQLNVPDAVPSASASVLPIPIGRIFLPGKPERLFINDSNFDALLRDPKILFQQQSCASGTSLNVPVKTSGLNDNEVAPPPFDFANLNPRRNVENCATNLVQAVPLHVLPSL